ncbi:MAG: CDP-alcohol phosphatidyltransferase family protein [Candidatus Altiarchaeales archaeon]|nr:CDP-alcohol phosphatidyltransferase family protein [Candidatus Altiarchaeales archaeon]
MYAFLKRVKFLLDNFFRPLFLFLHKIGFRPVHLTLLSFLFGLLGAFYFNVNWFYSFVFLVLWFLFDVGDGMLARIAGIESKSGAWLDFLVDRVVLVLVLYKYYEYSHALFFVSAGLLAVLVLSLGEVFRK